MNRKKCKENLITKILNINNQIINKATLQRPRTGTHTDISRWYVVPVREIEKMKKLMNELNTETEEMRTMIKRRTKMNKENQFNNVEQDEIIGTAIKGPKNIEGDLVEFGYKIIPAIESVQSQRKVITYKWEKVKNESYYEIIENGIGTFIKYGVDYNEHDSGPGNFSTAIVEMPDGSVKNLPLNLIKFLDVREE